MNALLTILVLFAYAQAPQADKKPKRHDQKVEAAKEKKDRAEQAVMGANKNKKCDGDGECSVIEMGERICGGPSSFLVYSESNPSASIVKEKVKEFTAAERELNLLDPPGDCGKSPTQPTPVCVQNACAAGK